MSSVVNWIENARFFGRPLLFKRQTNQTCEEAARSPAFQSSFDSCREQAAGDCATAGAETWSGDSCVCSSLDEYDQAFSECIFDTPYSDCINPNNQESVSDWSSGHCTTTTTPTTRSSTSSTTTTESTTSSTSSTSTSSSTSTTDTTTTTESSSELPESSDPPSTSTSQSSSTPEPSSPSTSSTGTSSEKPSTTPMSTPSSVPKPSLVPVTVASQVSTQTSSGASSSPSSTHSNLPRYTGSGNLLQGYCITPKYTLLEGATAYWAPVIGCIGNKPDCCPFDIPASTLAAGATGSIPPTVTLAIPQSGATTTLAVSGNNGGFPSALLPAQATLERCPDDYFSISDGCCPSNYFPWSTAFGGQTPCYSTLPTIMTPPPIPDSLLGAEPTSAAQPKPTSAIVNVVYAMQYPVKPASKPTLATNTKIGIGAGAGGAALVLGALIGLLIWKHRAHKRDKDTLKSLSGIGSTRQSVAASSAVGGVSEWRKNVPGSPTGGRFYEGLETIPEPQPTLPNVGMTQHYPADWRPGQRTISPPLPGTFVHNSIPSPPIPEGYSEADSQHAIINQRYTNNTTPGVRSDGGYSSGNRSELQSGEHFPRQELQGVPEEQQGWGQQGRHGYQDGAREPWSGQQGGQQARYYEAPAGRMTPRVG